MTDSEILYRLLDALERQGTEQDGNWGYMAFKDEVRALKACIALKVYRDESAKASLK